MLKSKINKVMSLFLSLVLLCTTFANIPLSSVANDYRGEDAYTHLVSYPRPQDVELLKGDWGHPTVNFLDGSYTVGEETTSIDWKTAGKSHYSAKYVTSDKGENWEISYCIQPGTELNSREKRTGSPDFLNNYSNDALSTDDLHLLLGRVLKYGFSYSGTNIPSKDVDGTIRYIDTTGKLVIVPNILKISRTGKALTPDEQAETIATQLLVWEVMVGERELKDFKYSKAHDDLPEGINPDPNGISRVKSIISANHPLRKQIFAKYDAIEYAVAHHEDIPDFMYETLDELDELKEEYIPKMDWDGTKYSYTFTDTNNVVNRFSEKDFKVSPSDLGAEISIDGNKLTITSQKAFDNDILVSFKNPNVGGGGGIAVWAKDTATVKNNLPTDPQALITKMDDPVKAYLKVKIGEGTVTIKKTGEMLTGVTEPKQKVTFNEIEYEIYEPVYSDYTLSGATFDIYTVNGNYFEGKYYKPGAKMIENVTSDSERNVNVQLPLGDYYAVEVETPDKMVWDGTPHYFSLNNNNETRPLGSLKNGVYNERQTVYISLEKRFETRIDDPSHNYKPYDYVVFGLFARNDIFAADGQKAIPAATPADPYNLVDWIRLEPDQDGYAQFTVDLPHGEYYIKELEWSRAYYPVLEEINLEFKYDKENNKVAYVDIEKCVVNTLPPGGTLRIEKNFPGISEHATGGGLECQDYNKMSSIGITNGQNWEEYSPIKVGKVLDGSFSREIICETERFEVGTMTANFSYNNNTRKYDLEIHYELLLGYALQQDARFAIANHPTCDDKNCGKHFTSKAYGDLTVGEQTYKNGETSGFITVSADTLEYYDIDINNRNQVFYVFLRLSKVAAGTIPDGLKTKGIVTRENRSWIDSGYQYEFMVFDLNDFEPFKGKGKDYADQKAIEKAVKTDVNGILAKGIKPIANPFCKAYNYVLVDLPTGKYLIAEIFRDSDGNIIDNPDFVTINGAVGSVYTINPNKTTTAEVINDFGKFYDDVRPGKIPNPEVVIRSTVSTDKAQYSEYNDVNISSIVTNYTANKSAKGYKNVIEIVNPEGNLVTQFTKRLSDILPENSFTVEKTWGTMSHMSGTYTVLSKIMASDNMVIHTSSTTFEIVRKQNPPLPILSGDLTPVDAKNADKLDEDGNKIWQFNENDAIKIRYEIENIEEPNTVGNAFTGTAQVKIFRIFKNQYGADIYEYVSDVFTLQIGSSNGDIFTIPDSEFEGFKPGLYVADFAGVMPDGTVIPIVSERFNILSDSADVSLDGSIMSVDTDGNEVWEFGSSENIYLGYDIQNLKDAEISGNAFVKVYRMGETEEDAPVEIYAYKTEILLDNLKIIWEQITVPDTDFEGNKQGSFIAVLTANTTDGAEFGFAECSFNIIDDGNPTSPVIDIPNVEAIFTDKVLFATGKDASNIGINLRGAFLTINGGIHSNSNIRVSSATLTVTDYIDTVGNSTLRNTGTNLFNKGERKVATVEMPNCIPQIINRLGDLLISLKDGTLTETSNEINIVGDANDLVTIASDIYSSKNIYINSQKMRSDNENGVLICSEGNITIDSPDVNFKGLIYAPNGTVTINGSSLTLEGRIIAKNIVYNGSFLTAKAYDGDLDLLR